MIRGNDKARFLSYVVKGDADSCWTWNGWKDSDGYGRFRVGKRKIVAHQYSYIMHTGEIPSGMVVMHTCDNPWCVNPVHLKVGTNRQNVDDMLLKGRQRKGDNHPRKMSPELFARGSSVGSAKLMESDIPAIRRRLKCGESSRSIASSYGVGHVAILRIKSGKTWWHVSPLEEPEG